MNEEAVQGIAEQVEQEAAELGMVVKPDWKSVTRRDRPPENHSPKARPADWSGGRLFTEEEAHRPWARFPSERNLTSHAERTDLVIHIAKVNFSAASLAWPISSCYSQPITKAMAFQIYSTSGATELASG